MEHAEREWRRLKELIKNGEHLPLPVRQYPQGGAADGSPSSAGHLVPSSWLSDKSSTIERS
jgi:hypothetical protein